jgi:hypothetical protein
MRENTIKPSQLPYEYQRGGISEANAKNYNCVKMKYKRLLNGRESSTNEAYFFNKAHFDTVLAFWNAQGVTMARKPNPVDGLIYHWSYEAA